MNLYTNLSIDKFVSLIQKLYQSSLIRNSLIYVVSDGINRAIPFLLLPFITHYLSPSDYGIVTNYNVYVQVLSVFCYLTTAGALPVMFYKLDKSKIKRYVSNMVLLNTYSNIFCLIVIVLTSSLSEEILSLSVLFQISALLVVWFAGITNINMVLWRCEEKPILFGIYQISQSAVNTLSTILFVIILLLGWKGRIYSMILATIIFGCISIYILYKRQYLNLCIDKQYLQQISLFALPLIPHALSFWFKSGVDKIMLSNMCGLSANGLYSVAMTWGSIVSMFLVSFNNAYSPYLYKKLAHFDTDRGGTKEEQKKLVRLIEYSFFATLIFILIIWVISVYLIQAIYAPSYHTSLEYLPWVMIGQFFYGGYLMFVCFVHYTLKTKILGAITFSWSLAQIAITYILISWIGAVGAAVSSAIVSIATFICVTAYAMKVYRLPWFSLNK